MRAPARSVSLSSCLASATSREIGDDRYQQVQNVSKIRPQGGAVFLQRACVALESRGEGLVVSAPPALSAS